MKTKSLFVFAAACLFGVACSEVIDDVNQPVASPAESVDFTVTVDAGATRSTSVTEAGEKTVNSLQVFVFRTDDSKVSLDVCGMAATNSVNLKCTTGPRRVYALVNAPDIRSSVFTEADLLAAETLLTDNTASTNLVMIGSADKTLTAPGESVNVDVKRIAASVVLNKISTAFTSDAMTKGEFKVTGVFLINVNGKNNYAVNAPTSDAGFWYNKLGLVDNAFPVEGITSDVNLSSVVTSDKPYDQVHTFYAYPNAEQYVNNATWSSRATLLVIQASFKNAGSTEGVTYYYPIAVENLESNKKYIIPEVIITRLGSKTPYEEVSFADCTFSVTVKDWDKSTMNSETI